MFSGGLNAGRVTLMPYLGLVRLRMHRLWGINVQGARSRHR